MAGPAYGDGCGTPPHPREWYLCVAGVVHAVEAGCACLVRRARAVKTRCSLLYAALFAGVVFSTSCACVLACILHSPCIQHRAISRSVDASRAVYAHVNSRPLWAPPGPHSDYCVPLVELQLLVLLRDRDAFHDPSSRLYAIGLCRPAYSAPTQMQGGTSNTCIPDLPLRVQCAVWQTRMTIDVTGTGKHCRVLI